MAHAPAVAAGVRWGLDRGRRAPDIASAALLAFVFLLLRWPFRSEYLVNWDAVQFALGTETFSLEHHQPHPPGYIGYVATGWFLNLFTGDPNTSLVLMSVVSGAVAPALFYLLAMEILGKRAPALIGALLLGTSPLVWYYSEVALTYMPEAALALGFAYAAYHARTRLSWRALIAATLLLTVLGSFRQTGMALLVPVFLWALWPFDRRTQIRAIALGVVTTLAWLVPLLWLSNGLGAYIRESAALGELAGSSTSVVSGGAAGIARNVFFVLVGLVTGLGAAVALPFVARLRGHRMVQGRSAAWQLLWLWTLPAMAVYLLGHTGQVGYMLVLLPPALIALLLVLGNALDAIPGASSMRHARVTSIVAVLVLANTGAFLWGPQSLMQLADAEGAPAVALPGAPPGEDESETLYERQFRQFVITENDAYWEAVIAQLEMYPADRSVVLTATGGPRISGSFRHLAYYLPDFRVLGVAPDRLGNLGHVVSAYGGATDYSVARIGQSEGVIALDPRVDRLLIPDPEVAALVEDHLLVQYIDIEGGPQLAVAYLPSPSTLVFDRQDGTPQLSYISQAVAAFER